jgi:hypothetical protein
MTTRMPPALKRDYVSLLVFAQLFALPLHAAELAHPVAAVQLPATPTEVEAPDTPPRWEAMPVIGIHTYSAASQLGRFKDDPSENSLAPGTVFGLHLNWKVWDHVAIAGEFAVLSTRAHDSGAGAIIARPVIGLEIEPWLTTIRPFLFVAGGINRLGSSNILWVIDDVDPVGIVGVGGKWLFDRDWGVRVEGRILPSPGTSGHPVALDLEAVVTVMGYFPWHRPTEKPKDRDKDKITDEHDACPDEAGDAKADGCPLDDDEKDDDEDDFSGDKDDITHVYDPDDDDDDAVDAAEDATADKAAAPDKATDKKQPEKPATDAKPGKKP